MFNFGRTTTASPTLPAAPQSPPILAPPPGTVPAASPEYPLDTLDAAQRELYARVRARVDAILAATGAEATPEAAAAAGAGPAQHPQHLTGAAVPGEREWADAECVVRYMRASKFDEAKCVEMLTRTLQWRRDYRPDLITAEEVEAESINGKAYWQGFDRHGRPIFVLNERKTKSDDPDRFVRFIIFNLENGPKLCPRGVPHISAIADVEGVSMFHSNPVSVTIKLADILQLSSPLMIPNRARFFNTSAHFIGISGKGMRVSVAHAFVDLRAVHRHRFYSRVFAKIVLPFVDPVTKAKIHFSTSKPSGAAASAKRGEKADVESDHQVGGWVEDVTTLVDPAQLPAALGGKYQYEYNHKVYWDSFLKAVGKSQ
ncbi:hypothetical protein HDU82_000132 [Entophlyctis luteolus]|nr:hypothetical protein HDU82_000132 [Entophlyctis luteolus]